MLFHHSDSGAARSVFRHETIYVLLVRLSDGCIEKGQVDRIGCDEVISILVVVYLNLDGLADCPSLRRKFEEGLGEDLVNGACA